MTSHIRRAGLLMGLAVFSVSSVLLAETPAPATGGKSTITVTAIGKKDMPPPSVGKDDVQLMVGKENKQVAGWNKSDSLGLAILIDDALDTNAANQWNDVRDFIMSLSPNTSVAIGYINNSNVTIAQDFTTDHQLAAKALRIPRGALGAGSSPYLAVMDWMKRWPDTGGARSLLLVSSGIDYFRGPGFGPFYPDVDSVIERAERQNINLWSIYYPTVGHRSRSFFLVNIGQNNLSKMTQATGGETYFLGSTAPVSFKPFLDEIRTHLGNQYLLTFAGDGGAKGKFVGVKLKTELPEVEFSHADQAFVGASK
jgi:hypothetical protein